VPIFRSVRDFINGSTTCQRIQFPLTPAYALTIHKSQAITVDQAVVGMSDRDFAVGLTYVAASRVRTLKGLMFEDTFDYQRIATSGGVTAANRGADRLLRLPQQIHPPATPRHRMGWTQHNTLSSQASLSQRSDDLSRIDLSTFGPESLSSQDTLYDLSPQGRQLHPQYQVSSQAIRTEHPAPRAALHPTVARDLAAFQRAIGVHSLRDCAQDDARAGEWPDHYTTQGNDENGGGGDGIISDSDVASIQSQHSFSSTGSSVR
jgi:hypothetical protein